MNYRETTVWRHRRPQCPDTHTSKPLPVPMKEFSPAIFLLLIGYGMSVFIILMEYICYYFPSRRTNEEDKTSNILPMTAEKE